MKKKSPPVRKKTDIKILYQDWTTFDMKNVSRVEFDGQYFLFYRDLTQKNFIEEGLVTKVNHMYVADLWIKSCKGKINVTVTEDGCDVAMFGNNMNNVPSFRFDFTHTKECF